jgi:hypothetical protein
LESEFDEIKFTYINRDKNQFVDALAILSSMTQINIGGGGGRIQPINIKFRNFQAHFCSLEETTNEKP